jgi:Holliday junction resolvase RusA-like endonuclease
MVEFTLDGLVPSKKNSRSLFYRDGQQVNVPNAKYTKWHRSAQKDLVPQIMGLSMPIAVEPLYIAYVFTMPDYTRRDLSNMIQSIEDLLKDMGVITDDAWKYLQIAGAVAVYEPKKSGVIFAVEDELEPLQKWLLTMKKH